MVIPKKEILAGMAAGGAAVTGSGAFTCSASKNGKVAGIKALEREIFLNTERGKKLNDFVKGADAAKCAKYGGTYENNQCSFPEEITKVAHMEVEVLNANNKPIENYILCKAQKGYFRKHISKSEACVGRNIVVGPPFRQNVYDWNGANGKKIKEHLENGTSMEHFYSTGLLDIRRSEEGVHLLIFTEEKQKDRGGDFPLNNEKSNGKGVAISDVCEFMKKVSGDEKDKGIYLYNEIKKSWWDCIREGYFFIVK